jgi:hypothetical protein
MPLADVGTERVLFPGQFDGSSIPPFANVPCTPHRTPADLAFGGSGHTHTTNSCPTRSASVGDFRGHAFQLMKRRWRHGLRRGCEGQDKGDSYESHHRLSPFPSPKKFEAHWSAAGSRWLPISEGSCRRNVRSSGTQHRLDQGPTTVQQRQRRRSRAIVSILFRCQPVDAGVRHARPPHRRRQGRGLSDLRARMGRSAGPLACGGSNRRRATS